MQVRPILKRLIESSHCSIIQIRIKMIPLRNRSSKIYQLVGSNSDDDYDVLVAYEALSDPDKRRKYDQCGEECLN